MMQTAAAERRDASTELRSVHRDGSIRSIVVSGRAVYDDAGKPLRMIGVVQDIAVRKAAEAALRQSEERFRLASIHSPFPVMLHADDGEVLQINDAWTKLTGYTARDIPTVKGWIERTYPTEQARGESWQLLARFSQNVGFIERRVQQIRCANGEERVWDVNHTSLGQLPDGRFLRVATAIDVTERQRDELILRQAKNEAEKANRAKSEFLSRMSHELRTPLNAILGFGQVLELSKLEKTDALCVHHIPKGGQHLLALIDEVLDLSRVETGELTLHPANVSLDELARECVGFVEKMAQARRVTCALQPLPAGRDAVWADEQRLRQVLFNLLTNTIKYNRAGGRVRLICEEMPGRRVRLNIRDEGPGISPEGLARLFVPFERLGQEFGEVEGTGLGLVVSRRLMEAMDGVLGAESRVGEGSTFWIELPPAADLAPARATKNGPN